MNTKKPSRPLIGTSAQPAKLAFGGQMGAKMKKITKIIAVMCCFAVGLSNLAGCSSPSGGDSSSSAEDTVQTSETAGGETDSSSGSLIIYTNSGGEGRDAWLIEQAKAAGFDITVMQLGGGDLANRAIAEKNNQVADVVFGLNPMEYERMKREDLLLAYEPAWSDEVDKGIADPDGMYYPIVIQPLLLTYNTDVYTAETAPQSWTDLGTNPEYQGKYTILSLGGATSRCILVGILSPYTDPDGELGISDEGWDVMEQFIQNGHIQQEGEDWFGACLSGERPITEIWASGLLQRINEMDVNNVDYVVPEIGTPYIVEQTAIFKNSKNVELAKEFIDWFGAAEQQAAWSAQFGTIPANTEALAQAGEDVREMMTRVQPQDIDWMFASEMLEQWVEKIELEFVE